MNTTKKILLAIMITSIAALSSCGGDDSPVPVVDPTLEIIEGLSKTWSVTSVTLDNSDETTDWSGFTLNFDLSKGFTASDLSDESVLVWPTSGSYSFPNANNANIILRSDGVQITIEDLTETSARLVFNITGRSGGRINGLVGEWVFDLGN